MKKLDGLTFIVFQIKNVLHSVWGKGLLGEHLRVFVDDPIPLVRTPDSPSSSSQLEDESS